VWYVDLGRRMHQLLDTMRTAGICLRAVQPWPVGMRHVLMDMDTALTCLRFDGMETAQQTRRE